MTEGLLEEAVQVGWEYIETHAEGPWSHPTFAAALAVAAPVIRAQAEDELRQKRVGKIVRDHEEIRSQEYQRIREAMLTKGVRERALDAYLAVEVSPGSARQHALERLASAFQGALDTLEGSDA